MAQIRQFHDPDELTEEELQVLREAENEPAFTGKYFDQVNAKILQDEMRIKNGLAPKYDQRDLLAESLQAAIMDADAEIDEILNRKN